MTKILAIGAIAALPVVALAQSAAPQSGPPAATPETVTITAQATFVNQYKSIKTLLTKTADLMPAEAYSFKPTPDMRTFAGNLGHILASDVAQCGLFLGRKGDLAGQDLEKTLTTKDETVKAAAATFTFCDEFFLKIDDKTPIIDGFSTMNGRRNGAPVIYKMSLGSGLVSFLVHNNEEYGYLAVYLRLKGIVPPSSQPHTPSPAQGVRGGAW
jgi:hypothetical protein